MNGAGWVCDECGKAEVLSVNRWVQHGAAEPPLGWYLLFKATPDKAAENERWEFCSVECIHEQTKPQVPS